MNVHHHNQDSHQETERKDRSNHHSSRPSPTKLATLILAALSILFASVAVAQPVQAVANSGGGIGISPSELVIKDVLRGQDYPTSIVILNDAQTAKNFQLRGEGDLGSWLLFGERGAELAEAKVSVPPGKAFVRVVIRVPSETANGDYSTKINVTAASDDGASGQRGSAVGVSFEIITKITVTGTQKLNATLGDIAILATEVGTDVLVRSRVVNGGNVGLPSAQTVVVFRKEKEIDKFDNLTERQFVGAGETKDVVTAWNTTDALPGAYEFVVHVFAGELDLGERRIGFDLAPSGSLSRSGELKSLVLVGSPTLGQPTSMRAVFFSTGKASTTAVLSVSVYQGNQLVATQKSLGMFTPPEQTVDLDVFFENLPKGSYRAVGQVNFDGRVTKELELKFGLGVVDANGSSPILFVGLALALLVVLIVAWLVLRRRSTAKQTGSIRGNSIQADSALEARRSA
jgi:hypothetical protein